MSQSNCNQILILSVDADNLGVWLQWECPISLMDPMQLQLQQTETHFTSLLGEEPAAAYGNSASRHL